MKKKDRIAVVTGGAKGIGRACCIKLIDMGYIVIFFDINDTSANELLNNDKSGKLFYYHCDISSPEEINTVCNNVLENYGTVSVLVNNAGIQTHHLFVDMTPEIWKQTIDINLNSAFYVCKKFVPDMIKQGFGRIVNIASMSARRGSNYHTHYCASKAGLVGFTRALSIEIAKYGVTVNAVCPGIVETDIIQETLAKKREIWLNEMHIKRLGRPEDIANAVGFLVSDSSDWVTGQALDINGGILTP